MQGRRTVPIILFIFVLVLISQTVLTQNATAASTFYVASMNQTIDPGAEDFVVSSLNDARSQGATTFILVLNTFGGSGLNMDHIITAISDYETASPSNTFITLIAPRGTHAFSAGAFIAEASTRIFMVPGTTVGSATPIVFGIPSGEENTTLTKDINGFTAFMQSLTTVHGRNPNATGLMVSKGVSYTAENARSLHVIDGLINATTVQDALTSPQIGAPANVEIHTPSIRSLAISVLSDPNIDGILFLLGTFAILADIYHPTLILSILGATALALALVGLGVFGASLVSIILMIIGALFIFLEIKTHHGISATIGVAVFIIGFLLIFGLPPTASSPSHPPANFIEIGALTYAVLGVVGGGVVLGSLYLYKVREALMRRPLAIEPRAVIGKEGYLTSDLKAGGVASANISAEDWTVTASQDLPKGTRIVVKEIQGLKLLVEKKEG